jgi:hypothetical protein
MENGPSGGGKGVLLGMPSSELVRELQDSVSAAAPPRARPRAAPRRAAALRR